ncbi:MAG: Na/Pi symporter, partial [Chitinophagaceae bacterium]
LQQYAQAPLVIFLVIGFMITSLIQSSSATVAITLSALYAGAFTLNDGIAIVLGSEIGTTMKLFVASIKGSSSKRRVALGNFLFNVITVLLVLIFLFPLSRLVTDVIGIKDNLIALVFFQTLVNIIGIILFYPLLNLFARFLENRYRNIEDEAMFIHKVKSVEPSLGIFALENESRHFLHTVLDFTWSCFEKENSHAISMELHKGFSGKTIPDKYAYIKFLHGEIHTFYIQLQKSVTEKEDIEKLDRLISSVRNGMYAAKSIKDAIPDMDQLRNSANDIKYNFFIQTRQSVDDFCNQIYELLNESPGQHFEKLTALYHSVTGNYSIILHQLYRESTAGQVSETEISTMINFNREVFTAFKSLVFGVKDYLFDKKQSGYFDDLPGFIR